MNHRVFFGLSCGFKWSGANTKQRLNYDLIQIDNFKVKHLLFMLVVEYKEAFATIFWLNLKETHSVFTLSGVFSAREFLEIIGMHF